MLCALFTGERSSEMNFTYLGVFILKDAFQFFLYASSDPKIHTVSQEASEPMLEGHSVSHVSVKKTPEFISLML